MTENTDSKNTKNNKLSEQNKQLNKPIQACVIGANGYGGIELVRLLAQHEYVNIHSLVSRSEAGQRVRDIFPHLQMLGDLRYIAPYDVDWTDIDVCFFATPHGVAMDQVQTILDKGIKVIDLSADFRIKNPLVWEKWYKTRHNAIELIAQAVYGLPEYNRELIKTANLVACPGCYPTSVQLGLLPLLKNDLLTTDTLIADVKSGISGSGRAAKVNMLYTERCENFEAYSVSGHRHYPEIQEQLSIIAQRDVSLIFTPHLLPIRKGIYATIYAKLKDASVNLTAIHDIYAEHYQSEPFVQVLDLGQYPQTQSVAGSNNVHIGLFQPPESEYITILVSEDNLIKGASGQAVQCMNLMFGIAETTGLMQISCV